MNSQPTKLSGDFGREKCRDPKHRGPRPLLRMADRLESDLAQHKGVQEHLEYLRKREALMQYPQFRRDSWPIGSGMVESANKNVVEARLKGTGIHWERTHVNSMLALRTAVCNDRWREMWQQALKHYRKLQTLHRSARTEQRAPAFLAVGKSCLLKSPPQSAAVSEQLSPPASSQRVSEAEAPLVSPPPPVPEASQPRSCRLSSRHKRQIARNRGKCSRQKSSEVNADACPCGTPLVRFKGHRPKQYCSDRCRKPRPPQAPHTDEAVPRLLSCSRFSAAEKSGGAPGEGFLSQIRGSERRNVPLLWHKAVAICGRPHERVLRLVAAATARIVSGKRRCHEMKGVRHRGKSWGIAT